MLYTCIYVVKSWHKGKSGGQLRSITQRHSTAQIQRCSLQGRVTGISGVSLKLTVRAGGSVVDLKLQQSLTGGVPVCDEWLGIR